MSKRKTKEALEFLLANGGIDGAHHKDWVIDQAVRILAGNKYPLVIAEYEGDGEYEWERGICP